MLVIGANLTNLFDKNLSFFLKIKKAMRRKFFFALLFLFLMFFYLSKKKSQRLLRGNFPRGSTNFPNPFVMILDSSIP
jgi:hypothetical protein